VQFDRLGALVEVYFRDDPNTCLIKLRQFGELVAQEAAAWIGLYTAGDVRNRISCGGLRAERAVPFGSTVLFRRLGGALRSRSYARSEWRCG
jgi:hypothetical protein